MTTTSDARKRLAEAAPAPELDVDALRRVAEAATPGPWEVEGQGPGPQSRNMGCGVVWTGHPDVFGGDIAMPAGDMYPRSGYSPREDMSHVATFDPPTVLALLDRLGDSDAENERLHTLANRLRTDAGRAEARERNLREAFTTLANEWADEFTGSTEGDVTMRAVVIKVRAILTGRADS